MKSILFFWLFLNEINRGVWAPAFAEGRTSGASVSVGPAESQSLWCPGHNWPRAHLSYLCHLNCYKQLTNRAQVSTEPMWARDYDAMANSFYLYSLKNNTSAHFKNNMVYIIENV